MIGRILALLAVALAILAGASLRVLSRSDHTWMPVSCTLLSINCPKAVYLEGEVHEPKLAVLKDMLKDLVEAGAFLAGRVSVFYKGKLAFDYTASTADGCIDRHLHRRIFTKDTLTKVFSSGKVCNKFLSSRP